MLEVIRSLLRALVDDPNDNDVKRVLADALNEVGDEENEEFVRSNTKRQYRIWFTFEPTDRVIENVSFPFVEMCDKYGVELPGRKKVANV